MERSTHRTTDGVELAVWSLPGTTTPDFLLVHGLASNARLWDGVAARLNARGHRVVSIDQRGHGQSAKPSVGFDFATLSADLAGLIETTMKPPVIACGQSFGGNLVLELAARYPGLVSGVVCVDGGFIDLRSVAPNWEEAKAILTPPALDQLRGAELDSFAAERYPSWPAEGIAGQLANLRVSAEGKVSRRLPLKSHLAILRAMWEQSPIELAGSVDLPVLVLAVPGRPPSHRVDQFVAALPRGRLHWIEGHHDLHAEQPDVVVQVIASAVDEGFLR